MLQIFNDLLSSKKGRLHNLVSKTMDRIQKTHGIWIKSQEQFR